MKVSRDNIITTRACVNALTRKRLKTDLNAMRHSTGMHKWWSAVAFVPSSSFTHVFRVSERNEELCRFFVRERRFAVERVLGRSRRASLSGNRLYLVGILFELRFSISPVVSLPVNFTLQSFWTRAIFVSFKSSKCITSSEVRHVHNILTLFIWHSLRSTTRWYTA